MPVNDDILLQIEDINAVNIDVNILEGEDQMLTLIGTSLSALLQTLGVNEDIGFTNIEFILPLDEELLPLASCIFFCETLRNFEQIYTQNTMVLVRKDVKVLIKEYNIFDVRYLVCLINVYFNFRFGINVEGVLRRRNYANSLILVEYEEFRLFGKICFVIISSFHLIVNEIVRQYLLLGQQNNFLAVMNIEADPLTRSRHIFLLHVNL